MKKHIAEELPARKFAPAAAPASTAMSRDGEKKGAKTPEERVRQAVYDIRYRARREKLTLSQAYSQYIQNSNMSQVEKTAVKKKLAGKDGQMNQMNEDYQIEDLVCTSLAKVYHKVFAEGVEKEEVKEEYIEELKASFNKAAADRKYKVRVTGNDGRSYVRYASREKINQLRANPNIKEVEMTEYGEPYEGERKRGEQTARAKAGKGLDPVGKEDGDIDNDGDKDKSDAYLANRRKVRGAAISRRSRVAEEFLGEIKNSKKSKRNQKYDVMKGTNNVTVMPPENKNMGEENEIIEAKLTKAQKAKKEEIVKSLKPEYGKTSKTYAIATSMAQKVAEGMGLEKDDEPKLKKSEGACGDPREMPTKLNLIKNKMRAMGLKMSYEPEGEVIDEAGGRHGGGSRVGQPGGPQSRDRRTPEEKAAADAAREESIRRSEDRAEARFGRRPSEKENVKEARRYGRPDRNAVGGADRTGGRYRNLGSPTDPREIDDDEKRAAKARREYEESQREQRG